MFLGKSNLLLQFHQLILRNETNIYRGTNENENEKKKKNCNNNVLHTSLDQSSKSFNCWTVLPIR